MFFTRQLKYVLLIIVSVGLPLTAADAGYTCGVGSVPAGAVCCSRTTYCNQGFTCGSGSECIPNSSPRACGGGEYCEKGYVCAPERGKCMPVDSPRYCGGKSFCKADEACVDNGKNCIKLSSDRYCGGGRYCEAGYHCAGNNKCAPNTSFQDFGAGNTIGSGGSGKISDACLKVGTSNRMGGMIGECIKKDGSTGHWYTTLVSSTRAEGCPQSIEFDYLDTDTGDVESYYTPFTVQTCDAPPAAIGVK